MTAPPPLPILDLRELEDTPVTELFETLRSGPDGLSDEEAGRRLAVFGRNELEEKRVHPLLRFLAYFWGPIPWMIEVAALLSAIVGHWADFAIISVLLLVNAVIGFWEEYKADNAIELLKRKLALTARVLRNGEWRTLPAAELVPGDVVRIRLGDIIPADLKLISGLSLDIDQSALTGESLPVEKTPGEIAYSGSIVQRGEMEALVVATGMNSYFGRTAKLVESAQSESHYQKAVLQVGHFLILSTLGLVGIVLIAALFRGTPLLETLQFCLVLTVAAIPVALPAVLSVTMAVGAVRLARHQAIVSRLVSIEEMAGIDVLCCDKTGTLTQNKLVLEEPVLFEPVDSQEIIRLAALASRDPERDPIEHAIYERLEDGGAGLGDYEVEHFEPFDPIRKYSNARIRHGSERFEVAKGAPQAIFTLCCRDDANASELARRLEATVSEFASHGYRTLGVARRNEGDARWRYLGVLPLADPPREDSAAMLREAREKGVQIKMVTGDHTAIAREIAARLDLGTRIRSVHEIFVDGQALDLDAIESADGFAEVFPEHKFAIVEGLQRRGHIVGMTGDGVNDAPALKKADMGIAVSGATDAARSAADLVLTAPGLSVIIEALKEARRIFERMTSYAIYRIAETIRVLLFMTLAILVFDFYPVTAVMIILLALLNDGPIMMIAYDNTKVDERPVRWRMNEVLTLSTALGLVGVFSSFGLFWLGERLLDLDRPTIQTLMFLKLTVAGHMTIYLTRSIERPFWRRPWPAGRLFWTAEATQVVATLFAVYGFFMKPIGWDLAALVWAYALGWFGFNEIVKRGTHRLIAHRTRAVRGHVERIHERLQPGRPHGWDRARRWSPRRTGGDDHV